MKQTGGALYPGPLPGGGLPEGQGWKLPLGLAIGIHVAILAAALIAPHFSERRPLPEIHTVNLFSAVEISPAPAARPQPRSPAPAAKPQPSQPVAIPEPAAREVKTLESEHVKKELPPPQATKPPISERPLPSRTASDDARLRELKRKAAAEEEARKAEEAARRAAAKALDIMRGDIHRQEESQSQPPPPAEASSPAPVMQPAPQTGGTGSTAAASGGEGVIVEGILRQYLADLHSRIQQHWTLPDLQKWDDTLEAVIVVKVRRDGIVTESFFERRSTNYHFDTFVEKAIRDASPLPPFPPALRDERLDIGLRFRPGGVY
jgi:colicin import membrane protein